MNSNFRSLIIDRLFSESKQADLYGASGGRSEGWTQALGYMVEKPITFITGFGWMAYWTFPFEISPHNTYLNYWFNLGLPGLLGMLFMLGTIIMTSYRTAINARTFEVKTLDDRVGVRRAGSFFRDFLRRALQPLDLHLGVVRGLHATRDDSESTRM